jgi:hypothetical protein
MKNEYLAFICNEAPGCTEEKRRNYANILERLVALSGESKEYCWLKWDTMTQEYLGWK